jgi:50S ribosomal protein L4, bacterial/organelle
MPNLKVLDMTGKEVGSIELSDVVFGAEVNAAVLHTAVRIHLMNQRQGTQSTLTRTEVSGGGKKPWRQKGTGRARQGSTRSPQWRHGGVALGPKPRDYRLQMNKKARRVAFISAVSSKVNNSDFVVIDAIKTDEYKTKTMVNMLKAVGAKRKTLVVLSEADSKVIRSMSNIPGVRTVQANTVSVYDVLNCDTCVFVKAAVEKLEEVYA